jgi:hypothetical protein
MNRRRGMIAFPSGWTVAPEIRVSIWSLMSVSFAASMQVEIASILSSSLFRPEMPALSAAVVGASAENH